MKRIIEKLKCIWHIIRDDEYAVYTVTIKDGKRVHNKTCCFISDNASKIFLECIREFTDKKIDEIYKLQVMKTEDYEKMSQLMGEG